ncbi:MAG: riboflavin synthase subunit alpha [Ilumatobacter sp.]|uniref:riboflavin synthase subunit alpha n=1 Tax=Ilumatobacter sp. TaxID=1967498 RepID=UPI003C78BD73
MFTGIVQDLCEVVHVDDRDGVRRLEVLLGDHADGLESGASVANNGVCLTASHIDGGRVRFDVISETVQLTNLRDVEVGSRVNIERSLKFGDELGGHILSGHVSGTMTVSRIEVDGANRTMWFSVAPDHMPYLMWKGWIAIDGASLTISRVERATNEIAVSLIPETLERTTLGGFDVGSIANLEVDAQTQTIVNTVRETLKDPNMRELLQQG